MRTIAFIGLMVLSCGSTAIADTDLEEQVRVNQQRIERLEEKIDVLQETVEYLESRLSSDASVVVSRDPLIGTWNCTNSLYTYEITFDADGNMVQQGAVLGNARSTTWSRAGESQILVGHVGADRTSQSLRLYPEFQSQDEFTVQIIESGTLWECLRVQE